MTNQKLGWKTDRETLPELVPEASPTGDSREILAEMFQTNDNYIGVAGRVLSDAPDLAEEVMTGAITLKKPSG